MGRWKPSIYQPHLGQISFLEKSSRWDKCEEEAGAASCNSQDWNQSFWLISSSGGLEKGGGIGGLPAKSEI